MRLSGVFLPHKKGTKDSTCVQMPVPASVKLPMLMGIGAPCVPAVRKGDKVTVGQLIGDTEKLLAAPIHSPVSGTVKNVDDMLLLNGRICPTITIESDGEQTVCPDIAPPSPTDKASFCAAVRASGCVGLGGAGFPTHIKLNYNEHKGHVDTLVINAAECEPYITSDCRVMLEEPEACADGIRQVMKYIGIERAFIGIEDNKPEAITEMRRVTAEDDNITVVKLKSMYPQGAEKVMAYNTTGRIIAEGELPSDKGLIVMNISTAAFISDYMRTGLPLMTRRLTVDGDIIDRPQNIIAPVGTAISDILRFCGADPDKAKKILMGGPMMGISVFDPDAPIIKTNNAILAFGKAREREERQTACINCGRCVAACPLKLMPCRFERAYDARDKETLLRLKVNLCMNCGACTYVCPAKRRLAEKNQLAKEMIRG